MANIFKSNTNQSNMFQGFGKPLDPFKGFGQPSNLSNAFSLFSNQPVNQGNNQQINQSKDQPINNLLNMSFQSIQSFPNNDISIINPQIQMNPIDINSTFANSMPKQADDSIANDYVLPIQPPKPIINQSFVQLTPKEIFENEVNTVFGLNPLII